MLLVKLRNGLELTWDSLDTGERRLVVYALCYLAVSLLLARRGAARERLKREIMEELGAVPA